jgi:hypothetical protein
MAVTVVDDTSCLIRILFHQVHPDCRQAQALKAEIDEKMVAGAVITGGVVGLVMGVVTLVLARQ